MLGLIKNSLRIEQLLLHISVLILITLNYHSSFAALHIVFQLQFAALVVRQTVRICRLSCSTSWPGHVDLSIRGTVLYQRLHMDMWNGSIDGALSVSRNSEHAPTQLVISTMQAKHLFNGQSLPLTNHLYYLSIFNYLLYFISIQQA